jgi:uncharacterized phiE125 gp8 family phage protein
VISKVVKQIHSSQSYISIQDVKDHLRTINTDEDGYIAGVLDAAFDIAENFIGYTIRTANVQWESAGWPADLVDLHGKPQSLTHIKYYTDSDVLTTWPTANYSAQLQRDRIRLYLHTTTPSVNDDRLDGVIFTAQMGWLPGNLPGAIKAAILLICGDLYEERKNEVIGAAETTLARGTEYLLKPYQITEFV